MKYTQLQIDGVSSLSTFILLLGGCAATRMGGKQSRQKNKQQAKSTVVRTAPQRMVLSSAAPTKHVNRQRATTTTAGGRRTLTDEQTTQDAEEGRELAEFLRSIAPFNNRWYVHEVLTAGTFGVVFTCDDGNGVNGVIKISKDKGPSDNIPQSGAPSTTKREPTVNELADFECFVLKKMHARLPNCSLVRVLDEGELEDPNGAHLQFMVTERAMVTIEQYLLAVSEKSVRRLRALRVSLSMLKPIYELHRFGILHRDLKPANMGLLSSVDDPHPIVVLFDLGLARFYTDGQGNLRPPRSMVDIKGTELYASGHVMKGRDHTRLDDLWSWLYVTIELLHPSFGSDTKLLPWEFRGDKAHAYFKSKYCPAYILLQGCPIELYRINSYLRMLPRFDVPNYDYLASEMYSAVQAAERECDQV